MSDGHDHSYEAGVDREVRLKGIVVTAIALALTVVVSAALMWWLSAFLRDTLVAADPPPPVLPEARIQEPPPEPRLQADPAGDLSILRAEEDEVLNGYSWIDEGAGVAHVPIERAMEMVAAGALDTGAEEETAGEATAGEVSSEETPVEASGGGS